MKALMGQFLHSIDAKGRVIMPQKLRDNLSETFIVTRGFDDCLNIYSEKEWEALGDKIRELPMSKRKDIQRHFYSFAADVTPDSMGRILIPAFLRDFAGLEKEALIIGSFDHCEIWNKDRFDSRDSLHDSKAISDIAESIEF